MSRGRHNKHKKGSNHPRWNNVIISSHGYRKIRVGVSHPLADPNGYAYEHLLVWVSSIAFYEKPPNGFLIHHKNGDILDNRIENLELKSIGDHNSLHINERGRNEKGQFLPKN